MAFGKNLCQTGATPAENNYCGGYVMSAVLSDLKKETDPMSVYKEMLDSQKIVSPSLQGFIDSTKRDGTDICLPSSLASYARGKGLAAGIGFAKQPSFPGEVTEEETQRCPEMVKQYDSAEQMLDNFCRFGPPVLPCARQGVSLGRRQTQIIGRQGFCGL